MQKEIEQAVQALQSGGVIAYATESVFGLGCDPDNEQAVRQLLQIKQRPIEKGLILIAAELAQLQPYLDLEQLNTEQLTQVINSWPGPYTWVMPAKASTPRWLTGQFNSIAVRLTDHPQVRALSLAFGKPLVSTSANLSGEPAARMLTDMSQQLTEQLAYLLPGAVQGRANPSEIKDARTGQILRSS